MFLSIIVPVYNAQTYLNQCIESLLNQNISNNDYEIICINDGSADTSAEILDDYSNNYSNIVVKHKTNSGVSASRNEGIKIARGDYLWFVDADDFIAPNILYNLKKLADSSNPDRITIESYTFDSILETQDTKKLKPNVPYKKLMATRTLYKKDFLNKNSITFTKGVHYGEDGLFNYQTLIYNPQTINSGLLAYFYRVHNASVTNAPKKQRIKKSLEGSKLVFDILVRDYNDKICLKETKRMLLYWMYGISEHYSILDAEYFVENFNWKYNLITSPFYDLETHRLHKKLLKISKTRNFNKIVKLVQAKKKKDIRNKVWQKNKKTFLGYIKHPKRLFKILIGK